MDKTRLNEIQAILLFAVAILVFISLVTFSFDDMGQFTSKPNMPVHNFAGLFGVYIGAVLSFVMGLSSYVMPVLVIFWALSKLSGIAPQKLYLKIFGTFFLILASSSIFSILGRGDNAFRFKLGGIVGLVFSDFLINYLGRGGAIVVIAVLLLLSALLATDFLLIPFLVGFFNKLKNKSEEYTDKLMNRNDASGMPSKKPLIKVAEAKTKTSLAAKLQAMKLPTVRKEPVITEPIIKVSQKPVSKEAPKARIEQPKPKEENGAKPEARPQAEVRAEVKIAPNFGIPGYKLPTLDLFDSPPPIESRKIEDDLKGNARILEETLRDFDIDSKVVEINKGPVITRYELEPAPGVKMHRITSLGDNIALALKAQSVRIVAPIPGKGTVGIEVPNSSSALVYLKEVLESKEYKESKSKLKLAIGKDIAGAPVIADLAAMPHLLIAGATGSGKTVCVNTIITSLLFNSAPDEVKFIMIDPKRVELAVFNDLPHLLSPVVTDTKKAAAVTLEWVTNEMDSRYELFARSSVRNIALYNEKYGTSAETKIPYIVVIIDELADLMMMARDEVERTITRIAQLSRAVGIHMIIATQRPSVDVITGVIKANFPSRISFKVSSKVDSRTVLDINGADKLLGRGDMLFVEPGASKPTRAQCSLIQDSEIERITGYIKSQGGPHYVTDIMETAKKVGGRKFDKDEVYEEAVRLILESKQASVSVLQRRLGLGYTRAARLIDMMEDEGIVGPYQGSKPRDLLITLEEYTVKSGTEK